MLYDVSTRRNIIINHLLNTIIFDRCVYTNTIYTILVTNAYIELVIKR